MDRGLSTEGEERHGPSIMNDSRLERGSPTCNANPSSLLMALEFSSAEKATCLSDFHRDMVAIASDNAGSFKVWRVRIAAIVGGV